MTYIHNTYKHTHILCVCSYLIDLKERKKKDRLMRDTITKKQEPRTTNIHKEKREKKKRNKSQFEFISDFTRNIFKTN